MRGLLLQFRSLIRLLIFNLIALRLRSNLPVVLLALFLHEEYVRLHLLLISLKPIDVLAQSLKALLVLLIVSLHLEEVLRDVLDAVNRL